MKKSAVGGAIRHLMHKKKIQALDLTIMMNVSRQTIGKWLNSKNISEEHATNLARIFGVDVEEICEEV